MSRILLVEDDDDLQFLAMLMLQQAGHVVTATDRAEVVVADRLDAGVDAIVLDIRLPGMSGLDLLRDHLDTVSGPPVLVMSAHAGQAHADEARALGARSFLPKPFDPDQLVAVVEHLLSSAA